MNNPRINDLKKHAPNIKKGLQVIEATGLIGADAKGSRQLLTTTKKQTPEHQIVTHLRNNKIFVYHNSILNNNKLSVKFKTSTGYFYPDIILPFQRTIIEHDGFVFHDRERDILKNQAAEQYGFKVIRIVQGSKRQKEKWKPVGAHDMFYAGKVIPQAILDKILSCL